MRNSFVPVYANVCAFYFAHGSHGYDHGDYLHLTSHYFSHDDAYLYQILNDYANMCANRENGFFIFFKRSVTITLDYAIFR